MNNNLRMSNSKRNHFNTHKEILDSHRNMFCLRYHTCKNQKGHNDTLPERKENNCFHAQKFRQRSEFHQVFLSGIKEDHQAPQTETHTEIVKEGKIKVGTCPRELTFMVVARGL